MDTVLSRIPCEDFLSSLLNREPFADTALLQNIAKIREKTTSQEMLAEYSDEETDTEESI